MIYYDEILIFSFKEFDNNYFDENYNYYVSYNYCIYCLDSCFCIIIEL